MQKDRTGIVEDINELEEFKWSGLLYIKEEKKL